MNEKINVILAAQRAADGLTRTLASVLMQANAPFAVTIVAVEDAPLPFAAENARLLRGQGDLLALWRAGLEACEGEWALLLHAGDALFDAYSLWRLADARRENPQAAAVYGAARCFGPDGREARGVDFRALPCGVLARREALLTALARAKTPFALAASLFAAAEETASISDCACEYALPEGWFEQLCGAADGLPGAPAGEWAERQLAALYLAYVQAGLSGPDEMQAARRDARRSSEPRGCRARAISRPICSSPPTAKRWTRPCVSTPKPKAATTPIPCLRIFYAWNAIEIRT